MQIFYDTVSKNLQLAIKELYGLEVEPPLWEVSSRQEFGDLSSMIAMKLSAGLKKPPLDIAKELKEALAKSLKNEVDKIEVLPPGFINLHISKSALFFSLEEILKDQASFFRRNFPKKILLEFVSGNPTGPLSIAHGRQAVIGDVIGNILSFFGNAVTREYYVNDEGKQIDNLTASVDALAKEIQGQAFTFPEDGYKGAYVKEVAQAYLDSGSKDIREFALEHILELIKKDLASLGINFNSWISQRSIMQEGKVEQAVALLKSKGLIYEKEDAIWFESTKFGDDKDRVIKKTDGELTYFASDIAYHGYKFTRGFESLINLWGPDHHGYIPRVKAAIDGLGFDSKALNVIIIQLVTIKTKERMSRRKGTAILLSDLVKEVGKDTARFYYLVRKNSSILEFDIDLAKEASFNNPLYYIQYVCARIESIFKKVEIKGFDSKYNQYLKTPEELNLLRFLLQFFYCLEKAYYTQEPVFIIEYLKGLAALFHKFYEANRVVGEEENIMRARLNLLQASKIVIHCGLGLLGIQPVEKM